ncbi:precorrin-8X methylmutase [Thermincola ferriacetica]|uniref:Precorrin-8X methylmutase n=1 Tax=Thermincola ferriacetica TaxID=281456 RepID=A0A0L6W6B9_9FIRM|nr:precorrin-8X methylmutase [Thermincola ferriacetica]KNZ70908.1 precorrin-8X methylmutase [Thermincola ferriacetica]
MDFVRDPIDIEKTSMQIIENSLPFLRKMPEGERAIIRRIVHTTGDLSCPELIKISPDAVEAGLKAIRAGRPVVTDVHMLQAGINSRKLARFNMTTYCFIKDPIVIEEAKRTGETRAMVAMKMKAELLDGAIVAIGNAPTALFTLCEMIKQDKIKPALVVGTPVGFVGARESKEELMNTPVPYITMIGTRGGSTIAVAAINALLNLAEEIF